ncbi:hypothetical protein [Sphingomonas faeni]|uniref:hypothetical protein n=1 Tax=Sphingomonas faeni TaxID=185950 RepID=UPI00335401DD
MPEIELTLRRFYSEKGRTSIGRMIVVILVASVIFYICGQTSWEYGRVAAAAVGAIAGAALAKLTVEGIRRLRDAGIDTRMAAWGLLLLGVLTIAAFGSFFVASPQVGRTLLSVLKWLVPIAVILPLLLPPRDSTAGHEPNDKGFRFAVACTVGGAVVALLLSSLSIGMDETNRRGMATQTEVRG